MSKYQMFTEKEPNSGLENDIQPAVSASQKNSNQKEYDLIMALPAIPSSIFSHLFVLPAEKHSLWNERLIFATEPSLAVIAIHAAYAKGRPQKERIHAFTEAMNEADKLIGENARDPRLRSQAAWDFYNDYLFDLLEL